MTDHRRTTHSRHCFGGLVRAPALGVLGNAAAGLAGNAAAAAGFDGTTAGLVSGAADARVTAAAGLGGSALLAFILPLVRPAPCSAGCGGGCGCAGAQRARPCEEAEQSVLLCAWSCHGRTASAICLSMRACSISCDRVAQHDQAVADAPSNGAVPWDRRATQSRRAPGIGASRGPAKTGHFDHAPSRASSAR